VWRLRIESRTAREADERIVIAAVQTYLVKGG